MSWACKWNSVAWQQLIPCSIWVFAPSNLQSQSFWNLQRQSGSGPQSLEVLQEGAVLQQNPCSSSPWVQLSEKPFHLSSTNSLLWAKEGNRYGWLWTWKIGAGTGTLLVPHGPVCQISGVMAHRRKAQSIKHVPKWNDYMSGSSRRLLKPMFMWLRSKTLSVDLASGPYKPSNLALSSMQNQPTASLPSVYPGTAGRLPVTTTQVPCVFLLTLKHSWISREPSGQKWTWELEALRYGCLNL